MCGLLRGVMCGANPAPGQAAEQLALARGRRTKDLVRAINDKPANHKLPQTTGNKQATRGTRHAARGKQHKRQRGGSREPGPRPATWPWPWPTSPLSTPPWSVGNGRGLTPDW
jgi:hypothetical protein